MTRAHLFRTGGPLLLAVALIAIAVIGYQMSRPPQSQQIACTDPIAGCVFYHDGTPVTLQLSNWPRPMQAFTLEVTAPGAQKAHAEFQMRGMEMGFNRFDLRPAGADILAARVTLPICVSGRQDWVLYLELDGIRYSTNFTSR